MNFSELMQIIKYLRKNVNCTHCQKSYDNDGIEVLSTFEDQGLFNLTCHQCQNLLLVHITISEDDKTQTEIITKLPQKNQRTHRSISEKDISATSLSEKHISPDDVINMHTFLNRFDGDFTDLFSSKEQ